MSTASFIDEDALLNDTGSDILQKITKEDENNLIGIPADVLDNNASQADEIDNANILLRNKIAESAIVEVPLVNESTITTIDLAIPIQSAVQNKQEAAINLTGNDSDVEMVEDIEPETIESLKLKLVASEKGAREIRIKLRRERAQHREECASYEARIKELQKMLAGGTSYVITKKEIKEEPTQEKMVEETPTTSTAFVMVSRPSVIQPQTRVSRSTEEKTNAASERFTKVRQRRSSSGSSDRDRKKSRETRKTTNDAKKSSRSEKNTAKDEKAKEGFGPNFYSAVFNPTRTADKENKKTSKSTRDTDRRRRSPRRPEKERKEIKLEWVHLRECEFACGNCGFSNDAMKREMLIRAIKRDKSAAPDYVKKTNSWINLEDRWFFCQSCDLKVEVISSENLEKKKKLMEERRDKRVRSPDRYSDRRRRRSPSTCNTRRNVTRGNNLVNRKRAHSKDRSSHTDIKKPMSRIETTIAVDQYLKREVDFEKGSLRSSEDLTFEEKEKLAMECLKALRYEQKMLLICGLKCELPPHLEELSQDPKRGHPWKKLKRDRLVTKEVLDTYSIEKREALKAQYNIKEPLAEHVLNPKAAKPEPSDTDRLNKWFDDFNNEVGPSTSQEGGSYTSDGDSDVYLIE